MGEGRGGGGSKGRVGKGGREVEQGRGRGGRGYGLRRVGGGREGTMCGRRGKARIGFEEGQALAAWAGTHSHGCERELMEGREGERRREADLGKRGLRGRHGLTQRRLRASPAQKRMASHFTPHLSLNPLPTWPPSTPLPTRRSAFTTAPCSTWTPTPQAASRSSTSCCSRRPSPRRHSPTCCCCTASPCTPSTTWRRMSLRRTHSTCPSSSARCVGGRGSAEAEAWR